MWQRFTDKSRRAIVAGQEEAKRLHCPYTCSEHLLLGLMNVGGVASKILQDLGASPAQMRDNIEAALATHFTSRIDFNQTVEETTPAMMQILQLAAKESALMQLDYIGTEHMLLALLHVEDGLATQVLAQQQLDLQKVRAHVRAYFQTKEAGDDHENA
jgi:ATP-dependent Clp protease ATP-binding subunit ClpC